MLKKVLYFSEISDNSMRCAIVYMLNLRKGYPLKKDDLKPFQQPRNMKKKIKLLEFRLKNKKKFGVQNLTYN